MRRQWRGNLRQNRHCSAKRLRQWEITLKLKKPWVKSKRRCGVIVSGRMNWWQLGYCLTKIITTQFNDSSNKLQTDELVCNECGLSYVRVAFIEWYSDSSFRSLYLLVLYVLILLSFSPNITTTSSNKRLNSAFSFTFAAIYYKEVSSEAHQAWMKVAATYGTDETKRLSDKYNEECMGLPGSFRTLNVD